jgi:hypothetical protein
MHRKHDWTTLRQVPCLVRAEQHFLDAAGSRGAARSRMHESWFGTTAGVGVRDQAWCDQVAERMGCEQVSPLAVGVEW